MVIALEILLGKKRSKAVDQRITPPVHGLDVRNSVMKNRYQFTDGSRLTLRRELEDAAAAFSCR